jgi:hypothetical protein
MINSGSQLHTLARPPLATTDRKWWPAKAPRSRSCLMQRYVNSVVSYTFWCAFPDISKHYMKLENVKMESQPRKIYKLRFQKIGRDVSRDALLSSLKDIYAVFTTLKQNDQQTVLTLPTHFHPPSIFFPLPFPLFSSFLYLTAPPPPPPPSPPPRTGRCPSRLLPTPSQRWTSLNI